MDAEPLAIISNDQFTITLTKQRWCFVVSVEGIRPLIRRLPLTTHIWSSEKALYFKVEDEGWFIAGNKGFKPWNPYERGHSVSQKKILDQLKLWGELKVINQPK